VSGDGIFFDFGELKKIGMFHRDVFVLVVLELFCKLRFVGALNIEISFRRPDESLIRQICIKFTNLINIFNIRNQLLGTLDIGRISDR